MRHFCYIYLICLKLTAVAQTSPNVILILTDDQGYGDLSYNGNHQINTPHMDQLASSGVRLDNFFVSPVCAPTRASLLTGRYHIRTGVVHVNGNKDVLRAEEVTLAEVFKQNGYQTGYFGKWHNGYHYPNHPNGQGFDEFFGFLGGHFPNYFDPALDHNAQKVRTDGFITDVLTDQALEWIAQNKSNPFFCYIPFNAPHTPYQVPETYYAKFSKLGFDPKTASIYGMIENLDYNVGRIIAALSELNIQENTIVIFMSDNGPNSGLRYNAGLKGHKTHVDEGGVKVPFFISWPGVIPEGIKSSQLSAHIDVLPTLADLCHLSLPKKLKLDGISLQSQILDESAPLLDRKIYSHMYYGGKLQPAKGTVRTAQYRYVLNPKEEGLYDMVNDPGQQTNIKNQKPELFTSLQTSYAQWFQTVSKDWCLESSIPTGYDDFPITKLQAVEAQLTGDLKFHGQGFVNDWIVNWVNPSDSIIWDLDVVSTGLYKISIHYTCPSEDVGSEITLSVGNLQLDKTVDTAFDQPLYPNQDRAPRAGELQKPWEQMGMGTINIKKGSTKLILTANRMAGQHVMEVKEITIEKLK